LQLVFELPKGVAQNRRGDSESALSQAPIRAAE
jgi:hypothetical protein